MVKRLSFKGAKFSSGQVVIYLFDLIKDEAKDPNDEHYFQYGDRQSSMSRPHSRVLIELLINGIKVAQEHEAEQDEKGQVEDLTVDEFDERGLEKVVEALENVQLGLLGRFWLLFFVDFFLLAESG